MSILTDAYQKWQEHCKAIQAATIIPRYEDAQDKKKRLSRAKHDYNFFVNYYFPHFAKFPCADFHITEANRVLKDKNFFGVWEWPREHAKSVHADVILPCWLWINGQLDGMILKGKNQDDADYLLSDIQAEFEFNQRLIADYGKQRKIGSWTDGEFEIADGILFKSYGRNVSVRGVRNREKRPNYYVFDDVDDDEIVLNERRVDDVVDIILGSDYGAMEIKGTRFLGVGNRIHPKSILAKIVGDIDGKPKRKGLHHSKVMATQDGTFTGKPTWHQKFTSEELQARFERMGYFLSMREYFHNPIVKGKIWKYDWIHWGKVPPLKEMDDIIAYFDPSYKPKTTNDYKAIKVWAKKGIKLYNINAFCKQTTITEAVKWFYDFHESLPEDVICDYYMEEVFLQDMFFEDFENESKIRGYYLPIHGDKRQKPDKYARIQAIAALWERGLVTYDVKQKQNAHMLAAIDQLLGFQKGANIHDDAPDADEGAIHILMQRGRQEAFPGKIGHRKKKGDW